MQQASGEKEGNCGGCSSWNPTRFESMQVHLGVFRVEGDAPSSLVLLQLLIYRWLSVFVHGALGTVSCSACVLHRNWYTATNPSHTHTLIRYQVTPQSCCQYNQIHKESGQDRDLPATRRFPPVDFSAHFRSMNHVLRASSCFWIVTRVLSSPSRILLMEKALCWTSITKITCWTWGKGRKSSSGLMRSVVDS